MNIYDPNDWYWIVGGDENRFWSSATKAYVDTLPNDAGVTRIASEAELWDVLASQAPSRLPDDAVAQDAIKEHEIGKVDTVLFKIAFQHENRIRALEGKQAVSAQQFRSAVKDLI